MTTDNLRNISPKDGFVVVQAAALSGEQISGLVDLYLPIMGAKAYGLYMLLSRYGKPRPNLVKRSMNKELLSGLSLGMRDLIESREKLEALGLLRTFEKTDRLGNLAIYALQSPLVGDAFFNDDLLSTILLETIGQGAYRKVQEKYCPPQFELDPKLEVTKTFLEVFQVQHGTLLQHASTKKQTSPTKEPEQLIKQNETDLDLKFFRQLLQKSFVPEDEAFKNLDAINTIHLLYGLDELQLVHLLEEAIDINTNHLNAKYFKKLAHESFDYLNQQQKPQTQSQPASAKPDQQPANSAPGGGSGQDEALLAACRAMLPLEFLQEIKEQNNSYMTNAERYMVMNLVSKQVLPNEVINVLIHFYLGDRGYATMKQEYFEDTAARWAKDGVKTAEEAMAEARQSVQNGKAKRENQAKKTNYRRQRPVVQKEQLPDWAQKDYQQPVATKEELDKKAALQAEIKRRLAEIKSDDHKNSK